MTFISLKRLFMGLALLTPAWLAGQEFDSELQLSSDVVYWYRICTAAPGLDGFAMTDVNTGSASDDYQNMAFVLPTETDDIRSQWKLTAGEDGTGMSTTASRHSLPQEPLASPPPPLATMLSNWRAWKMMA